MTSINLFRTILCIPFLFVLSVTACTDTVTDAELEPEFIIGDPDPDPEFFEVIDLEELEHILEFVEENGGFRHYQSRIDLTADGETNLVFDFTIQEISEGEPTASMLFFTAVNETYVGSSTDTIDFVEEKDYFSRAPYSVITAFSYLIEEEEVFGESSPFEWSSSVMLLGGTQSQNFGRFMAMFTPEPSYIPFKIGDRKGWAEVIIYFDLRNLIGELPEYKVVRAVLER